MKTYRVVYTYPTQDSGFYIGSLILQSDTSYDYESDYDDLSWEIRHRLKEEEGVFIENVFVLSVVPAKGKTRPWDERYRD